MELAELIVGAFYRHALTFEDVPRKRLSHYVVSARKLEDVSVEVLDLLLVAKEGLFQRNVEVHIQVGADALKNIVWLLLDDHNDIALEHVGHLLSLSFEKDLLIVGSTPSHLNGQCFRLLYDFFAFAGVTVFLARAAFALALVARLLHLHLHIQVELLQLLQVLHLILLRQELIL